MGGFSCKGFVAGVTISPPTILFFCAACLTGARRATACTGPKLCFFQSGQNHLPAALLCGLFQSSDRKHCSHCRTSTEHQIILCGETSNLRTDANFGIGSLSSFVRAVHPRLPTTARDNGCLNGAVGPDVDWFSLFSGATPAKKQTVY